jgi:RNA ligase (TIGR02306 family)
MERKLASIQKVLELAPIEGADRIEIAKVLGWQCVVKKNEFKPGDMGIFFEIDSIVDSTNPMVSFMSDKKYRVKTCKLRKTLSQGLFVPLDYLKHYPLPDNIVEGLDVTELTKTQKWELPVPVELQGLMRGNFPTNIISKTDEERIQSAPRLLADFAGKEVYGSLKMDGTSLTAFTLEGQRRICSRNVEFKVEENPDNLYVKMAKDLDIPEGFAIQGEIVGQSVQGNKMGLGGQKLYVFNVIELANRRRLNLDEMIEFCTKHGMETVPIVFRGLFPFNSVDEMLEFSDKQEYPNHTPAEGVVWRPVMETYSERLQGSLSVKAISNKFLLKYGE